MKKLLGCVCLIVLFAACSKTITEETTTITDQAAVSATPGILCLSGNCVVTGGSGFFDVLSYGYYPVGNGSDLVNELSGTYYLGGPSGITYNNENNPVTCSGLSFSSCHTINYNSSFSYENGKIKSILAEHTFQPNCPSGQYLANKHQADRIDFVHSYRIVNQGSFPMLLPVITATIFKSDTVDLALPYTNFVATGESYYYEFNLSGTKLILKRYKPTAAAIATEYKYTYLSSGNLYTIGVGNEGGNEKYRYAFATYDSRKGYVSGSPVMQLLTSDYNVNNPKQWGVANFVNFTNVFFTASYTYNSRCYPTSIDASVVNGGTLGIRHCNYSCGQ